MTALRLATAAPVAAGPVLFERLDWRPYGVRPVLQIAATAPPGEPTRLDPFRASVAQKLRPLLALADEDAKLGDALDRWELALFQDDPFRSEQLRHALDSALGNGEGAWAAGMRAAALLGETAKERAQLVDAVREPTTDLVRRLARRDAPAREPARAAPRARCDAARQRTRCTAARKLTHLRR